MLAGQWVPYKACDTGIFAFSGMMHFIIGLIPLTVQCRFHPFLGNTWLNTLKPEHLSSEPLHKYIFSRYH